MNETLKEELLQSIREVKDYPKKGFYSKTLPRYSTTLNSLTNSLTRSKNAISLSI